MPLPGLQRSGSSHRSRLGRSLESWVGSKRCWETWILRVQDTTISLSRLIKAGLPHSLWAGEMASPRRPSLRVNSTTVRSLGNVHRSGGVTNNLCRFYQRAAKPASVAPHACCCMYEFTKAPVLISNPEKLIHSLQVL